MCFSANATALFQVLSSSEIKYRSCDVPDGLARRCAMYFPMDEVCVNDTGTVPKSGIAANLAERESEIGKTVTFVGSGT